MQVRSASWSWAAIAFLLLGGCGGRPSANAGISSQVASSTLERALSHTVRVGLLVGVDAVTLESEGVFRLQGLAPPARTVRVAGTVRARVERGSMVLEDPVGTVRTEARQIVLQASSAANWTVKGDRFGGDLILRRNDDGTLTLVNHVPVETYLRGVVPWEIGRPSEDALEAVKAQAIAARTYTYSHLGHWEGLGFDLYADTRDQVYRGLTGTAEITDRAVRETTHRVAVHRGELIRAYYSSTNGGFGATLTDVWQKEGAEYLRGARDADARGRSYCADSPHFRWTETWSARELGEVIRANLPAELGRQLSPWDIGTVENVEVVARDASGRVQRLRITTDLDTYEVWGDRIRWVLRPVRGRFDMLRSTMFSLEPVRRDGKLVGWIARGGGFGHGVGLCQTGALGRARAGQDAATILRAYYQGIDVVDVRSLRAHGRAR